MSLEASISEQVLPYSRNKAKSSPTLMWPKLTEVMSVGSGREISIKDLVHLAAKLCDKTVSIHTDEDRIRPQGSEVERLLCCAKRITNTIGWKPNISLEDGLKKTISWTKSEVDLSRAGKYHR